MVLAIAFVFEGTSLVRAVLQVRAGASRSRSSFAQFVRELRDPAPRVVFLEDSAAVVGIAIAALGIAARQITGDALWDGLAVGVLLAGVAIAVGSTQMIAFGILYSWPWLERFFSDDPEPHHLLQMPRDNPVRSAFGAALFTWVAVPLFAGSADRVFVTFSYSSQFTVLRILWLVLPIAAFVLTLRVCRGLHDSGRHPLRGWTVNVIRRNPAGGFEPPNDTPAAATRRGSES